MLIDDIIFLKFTKKNIFVIIFLGEIAMRTKNSIKNIISVVIFNLIVGILGFIKVRVFVNGLSNDVYSLNQLFYQIFGYLTIADVGFALVLNHQLYKAFANNDKKEINKIYSTSKKFYNILGIIFIVISLILSFFVHYLTKASVSNFYIQIVFIIFIIRNVVDYFFIAPRYVMEANQKNYKINHLVRSIKIIETIIEIILVLCGYNYLIVLIPGIIITILLDSYINQIVFKEYPWIDGKYKFNKKYLSGTKDLIYLKLSGIMNSNTDIILISTFINPISVIIYTSYSYITKFVTDTIYIIASSLTPSYANVLCKEKKDKIYSIFTELNIFFLILGSFVCIMFYAFLSPLISFWVGEEYLTTNLTLLLFCVIAFQNISMRPIMITINSKGLFKETKMATILETIINFVISFALVHKFGLIGVLVGTVVSYLVTSFIQNAIYIYKNIFHKNPLHYFAIYSIVAAITAIFLICFKLINLSITNILSWITYVIITAIIVGILLLIIYFLTFKSFRRLVNRIIEFIKAKK